MQRIVPHLWFDKEAKEAAAFYTSVFNSKDLPTDSKIKFVTTLHDTPSGNADVVSFTLWGYSFMAISAGPLFKFNPSISFMINFDPSRLKDAGMQIDIMWEKLSKDGKVLMQLDKYPFSEKYGWIQDKYGLSWQLMLTNPAGEARPLIIPSMMFVGNVCGKAEEATDDYISIFNNSKRGVLQRYKSGQEPDKEGTIVFTDFMLDGQWFVAMDSAHKHDFAYNEAISLIVHCDTQKEIDYYWGELSANPASEQCGWLKDKYGISWQIIPNLMDEIMRKGSREEIERVTQTFLPMKKLNIEQIKKAYEEK